MARFWNFTAAKKKRVEIGRGCTGNVQAGAVANVKNFAGSQSKLLGGLLEDGR